MSIVRIVRARDWWDYKIPPLLGAAYVLLLMADVSFPTAVTAVGAWVIFLVGTASFGYFVNDLCDIEADRAAGKRNRSAELGLAGRAGTLLGTLLLVALPWRMLPASEGVLILVAVELILLVAYAAPPIRLKARGAPALVADALYAHTVPMLIAIWAFGAFLPQPPANARIVVGLVAAWTFLTGFRGILLHQVDDATADRAAGVRTAVTLRSRTRAVSLVTFVVMPLELGLLGGLTFLLDPVLPHFAWLTAAALAILSVRARRVFGPLSQPSAGEGEGTAGWRLEGEIGPGASLIRSGAGLRVTPGGSGSSEAWRIRLRSRPVVARAGQPHRLRIRLRADTPRPVELALTETDEPWDTLGPYERHELDVNPREIEVDIPAPPRDTPVSVQINLASARGPVEIESASLLRISDGRDLLVPSDDEPRPVDRSPLGRRRRFADFYGSGVLNDYYERWMPLFPLVLLAVRDPMYWGLAAVHVLAFRGIVRR